MDAARTPPCHPLAIMARRGGDEPAGGGEDQRGVERVGFARARPAGEAGEGWLRCRRRVKAYTRDPCQHPPPGDDVGGRAKP